jgi:hypothetical protein
MDLDGKTMGRCCVVVQDMFSPIILVDIWLLIA